MDTVKNIWFRHYFGLCRDTKLVSVAIRSKQSIERVVWIWCAILESAGECNDQGRYELDITEVSYFLRSEESDIQAIIDALEASGRLQDSRVTHWATRQYQSDHSRERMRKYRERKANVERERQNLALIEQAHVTPPRRHSDGPESDSDSEANSDVRSTHISAPRTVMLETLAANPQVVATRKAIAEAYMKVGALPPDTSRVAIWIADGCTPDEIISCVSAKLTRGIIPNSMKYFDWALADARSAPRAPPNVRKTGRRGSSTISEALDRIGHDGRASQSSSTTALCILPKL